MNLVYQAYLALLNMLFVLGKNSKQLTQYDFIRFKTELKYIAKLEKQTKQMAPVDECYAFW